MRPTVLSNSRLVDLLVQRTIDGTLNASERMELKQLLGQQPYRDSEQFERTAAALMIAGAAEEEPLPRSLRNRLMQQADAFSAHVAQPKVTNIVAVSRPQRRRPAPQSAYVPPYAQEEEIPSSNSSSSGGRMAWFAVAASVLLAVAGWWPRLAGMVGVSGQGDQVAQAPSLEQQRAQLASRDTAIERPWTATSEPEAKGAQGDVVWDPQTQQGYVRFRGLAANNPTKQQYQLWIFDAARGDKYPVDGGVFDIPAGDGEVVVPIQARLPVSDPAMFAVTLERAGGVVVSEREHIVVLARV